mgnify:CR=1 FL=1
MSSIIRILLFIIFSIFFILNAPFIFSFLSFLFSVLCGTIFLVLYNILLSIFICKILEIIYDLFSTMGIYNIGFCIILFTIVVRMLMLPMQIKQQKFSKLNSVMTPEIQKIQKKYQGKKDQQSQLAQQEEIKAVYDKYGTSPTGSCLQLLIQMPILFALYRVIMNVPAYVKPVKDLYLQVLNGLNATQMKQFFGIDGLASGLSQDKINGCIDAMSGYTSSGSGVKLSDGVTLSKILEVADKGVADKIEGINNFFGLNLSMSPSGMFNAGMISIIVALIIPILSGLFQFLSVQLSQKLNGAAMDSADNPMASSMKIMNIMMPLMSIYMCWILSAGIGLYWMAGSLIMMLQQIFINIHMKKVDVNDIIEANKEKAAAKAEKRKQKEGIYRDKVLEASKTNTKNISGNSKRSASEKEEKIRKTAIIYSPVDGIAADLSTAPDEGFAGKMMGDGAVVTPTEGTVYAPADGEVEFIFDTKHAIGFQTDSGIPMLLHMGIDTVKLEGKGFEILVTEGQKVKKGDPMMKLDLEFLTANAPSITSPILDTEPEDNQRIRLLANGEIKAGEPLFAVETLE